MSKKSHKGGGGGGRTEAEAHGSSQAAQGGAARWTYGDRRGRFVAFAVRGRDFRRTPGFFRAKSRFFPREISVFSGRGLRFLTGYAGPAAGAVLSDGVRPFTSSRCRVVTVCGDSRPRRVNLSHSPMYMRQRRGVEVQRKKNVTRLTAWPSAMGTIDTIKIQETPYYT